MKVVEEKLRKVLVNLLGFIIRPKRVDPSKIDFKSIKKILIVKQHNEAGDMLLSTPLFSAIRNKFPESFISLIVRPKNMGVVLDNPDLNEIVLFDIRTYRKSPWKILGFLYRIRKSNFDIAIVPSTISFSLTSALLSYLSGAKYRIGTDGKNFGFYDESAFFFNIYVPFKNVERHHADINLDFIRILGFNAVLEMANKMAVSPKEESYADNLLREMAGNNDCYFICVHPGAGKIQNRWQSYKFGKLIENIYGFPMKKPVNVLLMYGPGEKQIAEEVLNSTKVKPKVLPLVDLRKLAAILKQCKLFICNDTGTLHVAAGVGTPTLAIFGPTDPGCYNPIGKNHVAIRGKSCTMDTVTVEEVVDKFKEMVTW